jgi:hypothetical protein
MIGVGPRLTARKLAVKFERNGLTDEPLKHCPKLKKSPGGNGGDGEFHLGFFNLGETITAHNVCIGKMYQELNKLQPTLLNRKGSIWDTPSHK